MTTLVFDYLNFADDDERAEIRSKIDSEECCYDCKWNIYEAGDSMGKAFADADWGVFWCRDCFYEWTESVDSATSDAYEQDIWYMIRLSTDNCSSEEDRCDLCYEQLWCQGDWYASGTACGDKVCCACAPEIVPAATDDDSSTEESPLSAERWCGVCDELLDFEDYHGALPLARLRFFRGFFVLRPYKITLPCVSCWCSRLSNSAYGLVRAVCVFFFLVADTVKCDTYDRPSSVRRARTLWGILVTIHTVAGQSLQFSRVSRPQLSPRETSHTPYFCQLKNSDTSTPLFPTSPAQAASRS